jgi:hypothetical protein
MTEAAADKASASGREQRLLAGLAALIVVIFALYTNTHKVLWTDEAYSLETSRGGLGRTLDQAIHFELQPPLYYLLLNLWLRLWRSIEFARLLSTVCAVAAIPLLYRIGRILRISGWAVSLPLLAALCPYVLWSASEARPYGLAVFLSCGTIYCYARLLTEPREHLRLVAALYVVIWTLCILTFYYSGFLLLAQVAGAVVGRRRTGLITLCAAIVGLLLVPWIPTILMQVQVHPETSPATVIGGTTVLERGWGALAWGFRYTLESLFFAPALRRPVVLGILAVCLAAFAVAHWRHRGLAARDPLLPVFATTALLPLAVLLGIKVSGLLEFWPRYFAVLAAPFLVWMALVADRFPAPRGRYVLGGSMTLFGALSVVSFQRISGGYEDWRAAASLVRAGEAPGDVVFVFEPDGVLAFRYYYQGQQPIFGLPVDRPTAEYSVERQAIHSIDQVAARVRAKVAPGGAFWVVARHHQAAFGRALLEAYLDHHTTPLGASHPEGIDVGRFRLDRVAASGAGPSAARGSAGTPSRRPVPPTKVAE